MRYEMPWHKYSRKLVPIVERVPRLQVGCIHSESQCAGGAVLYLIVFSTRLVLLLSLSTASASSAIVVKLASANRIEHAPDSTNRHTHT